MGNAKILSGHENGIYLSDLPAKQWTGYKSCFKKWFLQAIWADKKIFTFSKSAGKDSLQKTLNGINSLEEEFVWAIWQCPIEPGYDKGT